MKAQFPSWEKPFNMEEYGKPSEANNATFHPTPMVAGQVSTVDFRWLPLQGSGLCRPSSRGFEGFPHFGHQSLVFFQLAGRGAEPEFGKSEFAELG
jgi:hypothetical protein